MLSSSCMWTCMWIFKLWLIAWHQMTKSSMGMIHTYKYLLYHNHKILKPQYPGIFDHVYFKNCIAPHLPAIWYRRQIQCVRWRGLHHTKLPWGVISLTALLPTSLGVINKPYWDEQLLVGRKECFIILTLHMQYICSFPYSSVAQGPIGSRKGILVCIMKRFCSTFSTKYIKW